MSLQLDSRQRAMLEEMGVRVFWPEAVQEQEAVELPVARVERAAAPVARVEQPAVARPAAPAIPAVAPDLSDVDQLDWDSLEQAVTQWAVARRRKPVFGTGDRRADWLCVGEPPLEEEELQGLPFAGDAGKLLDNMLAAVGAAHRQGAYLTNALKCRLPDNREQEAEDFAQSLGFLQRQVQLVQPRVILAMGRFAVQALLQTTEPIGKLRGRVHRYGDVPVIVTYHPAYLLRNLPDKARAWADLCLAQSLVRSAD
jgi:uracil-DNA glycosylase